MTWKSPAFTKLEAQRLLYGKRIAILGSSVQRTAYKDLILLLQENRFMTKSENRARGHRSILNDKLLAGGEMGQLNNDPNYTEVREFVKDSFSIRFYFITRAWYPYVNNEVIPALVSYVPDAVFISSMLWDIMTYGDTFLSGEYRAHLDKLFSEVVKSVPATCIITFLNSPPVGDNCYGGVLVKQVLHKKPYLKKWHIEACQIAKSVVSQHELDIIDFLEYLLPYQDQLIKDGLHWSSGAHRAITNRLLTHLAYCWGKEPATQHLVTGLGGLKTIYDDPEDAFLEEIRYLFDENPSSSTLLYNSSHPSLQYVHKPSLNYVDSSFSSDFSCYDRNNNLMTHFDDGISSDSYSKFQPPLRLLSRLGPKSSFSSRRIREFEYQDVDIPRSLSRKRKALDYHISAPPEKFLKPLSFQHHYAHSRANGNQNFSGTTYLEPVGRSIFWQ